MASSTPEENRPDDNDNGTGGDDEQSWVLDSLVGFLKSPLWSSSLNDFIDKNSIVFDPDGIEDNDGQVVHRPEYEKIFRQYRSLVDRLIGSHMTELGIDEHQFAKACQMAEGVLAAKFKRILFEELWAAENYEVFVRLMAKRNVELQLEALEMLVHKFGLVYDVFVPIGTSPKNFLSEEHVMREAILRSLNDMQLEEEQEKEPKMFERKPLDGNDDDENETKEKPEETDKETVQRDAARLVEVKELADRKMVQALQSAMIEKDDDGDDVEQSLEDDSLNEEASKDDAEDKETTVEQNQSIENRIGLSADDIAKRADYLREQRDKILRQRQKERTERISKYLTKEKQNPARPRTSKPESEGEKSEDRPAASPDPGLAFRKSLAARLKAEVVLGGTQK